MFSVKTIQQLFIVLLIYQKIICYCLETVLDHIDTISSNIYLL